MVFAAVGALAAVYAFVCAVDPWGALPVSLPLPRVPVSSNARYAMPAVARATRFDAAVLGTSTSRAIRPALLDAATGLSFANLSMNSATAWEQVQMLRVFLAAHPRARAVAIGLDVVWCDPAPARTRGDSAFPQWVYRDDRWAGYAHMLTPYAVQEAVKAAAVMVHWKRQEYGSDGYTRFTPPEDQYDPARVDVAFARWGPVDDAPARAVPELPPMGMLDEALGMVPSVTKVVLWFPALHAGRQGAPGGATSALWAACKARVGAIARAHGALVVDFLRVTPQTEDRANYWDPLHVRQPVADAEAEAIAAALRD